MCWTPLPRQLLPALQKKVVVVAAVLPEGKKQKEEEEKGLASLCGWWRLGLRWLVGCGSRACPPPEPSDSGVVVERAKRQCLHCARQCSQPT